MPKQRGPKDQGQRPDGVFIFGALTRQCHWKTRADLELNKNAIMRRKRRVADSDRQLEWVSLLLL